jgi:sec-independent protein translocase protein TatB
MFGMGMGELVVILIVALLVLGPTQLPSAAKAIGKGIRELRRHTTDLQETLEQDEHIGGTVRELKSALRGEDPPASIRPPAKKPPEKPGEKAPEPIAAKDPSALPEPPPAAPEPPKDTPKDS